MERVINITRKIRETINVYGMITPGDKVIVALSGGPDSVCLYDALNLLSNEFQLKLIVAHYNHGFRKTEDELETHLTRNLASALDIPFETEKAFFFKKNLPSQEELARNARYAFLEKIRVKHCAQKIAMGHTLNDQAETIIMRLLRGSGATGLAGIPPVREGRIIRPLIEVTRDEVMDYIKANDLPFAVDSSNNNKKHLRNRIRQELIPLMLEYQPKLLERLGTFSNIIREENELLESMALDWIDKEALKAGNKEISVSVLPLRNLHIALQNRVIRNLLKQISRSVYPVEYDHVESVLNLVNNKQPQCSVDLPNGIIVKKRYETLHFTLGELNRLAGHNRTTPHPDSPSRGERELYLKTSSQDERKFIRKKRLKSTEFIFSIERPGVYQMNSIEKTLTLEYIDTGVTLSSFGKDSSIAYLDADKINYPLIARNFRHGDRFMPLGMKGHKKVKNFFIDLKVPSEERVSTPLLTTSNDQIVWVCGFRIDDRFKVTPITKRILRVSIVPNKN